MSKISKGTTLPQVPVGFFNSNKVWGGGEKWHHGAALMMMGRNWKVTVFAQSGCELLKRAQRSGIPSVGIRVSNVSFLNPFKVLRLARSLRRLQIQAIILNLPSDVKFAGIAARLAGVKKIMYRRGSPLFVRDTLMNRFLFRHILTHIIANSEQIKRSILHNNPSLVDPEKITVIYNGVDGPLGPENNSPAGPVALTHGVVLGTAGRLSAEKGMEWAILLAHDLKEKKLDFTLLIAGEGPLMHNLTKKSRDLGLTDHIRFCGFIVDMDRFYRSIDLFILTSEWEGCSNVILEAMEKGLPVVAFNNSSIPEMVEHNTTGFLVGNKNGCELAEKVEILIREPDLRIKFGAAGKQWVREKYDLNRSFDMLIKLIQQ
jgi:glycosyltransferase involved in cell wall biosynthesis